MTLYRTRTPAVLSSAAYRARLEAPTPRTREVMRHYRNQTRTVCRVAHCVGDAAGGAAAALAGRGPPGEWPIEALWQDLSGSPGILRCRWILAEPVAMGVTATVEGALRNAPDAAISWAAIVDANEVADAERALGVLREALQPASTVHSAVYRLVYAAHRV
jgi:hypothetical protein